MSVNAESSKNIDYVAPKNVNDFFDRFVPTVVDESALYDYDSCLEQAKKVGSSLKYFETLKDVSDLEAEAKTILTEHSEAMKCIPVLLRLPAAKKDFLYEEGMMSIDFKNFTNPVEDYVRVLSKSGVLKMINLALNDPLMGMMVGVNMGSNTNGRKNRYGKAFENLVEKHVADTGAKKVEHESELDMFSYKNQAKTSKLTSAFGIDFSKFGDAIKQFDHLIKVGKTIIAIEDSCYTASGSKPNEVARSYTELGHIAKNMENFILVHVVDGYGWKCSLKNLADEMKAVEHVYCLADLEAGALKQLVESVKEKELSTSQEN